MLIFKYINTNINVKKQIQSNLIKALKLALNVYGLHFLDTIRYPKIRRSNNYWERYSVLIE